MGCGGRFAPPLPRVERGGNPFRLGGEGTPSSRRTPGRSRRWGRSPKPTGGLPPSSGAWAWGRVQPRYPRRRARENCSKPFRPPGTRPGSQKDFPCNASAYCARAGFFPAPGQMGSQRRWARRRRVAAGDPHLLVTKLDSGKTAGNAQGPARPGGGQVQCRARRTSWASGSVIQEARRKRPSAASTTTKPPAIRRSPRYKSWAKSRREPTACPPGPRST
jgi:hypothetical protein